MPLSGIGAARPDSGQVYVGMPQRKAASKPAALQFGWGWCSHEAIEQAAVNRQSAGSYKTYLNEHLKTIHEASSDQDRFHMGPGHYVNLEGEIPSSKTERRKFETVRQVFSRANRESRARAFQQHPLQPHTLPDTNNVLQECVNGYARLVDTLKKAHRFGLPKAEKEKIAGQLDTALGSLAHYVADLHQPMHTTTYHTWNLAHPFSNLSKRRPDSHFYLENRVMNRADYTIWGNRFAQQAPAPTLLDTPTIQNRLLRQVEQGHLQMFNLVKTDGNVRSRLLPTEQYFEALKTAWQPMMEDRMSAAGQLLSDILASAYAAAGRPDLNNLETDPFRQLSRLPVDKLAPDTPGTGQAPAQGPNPGLDQQGSGGLDGHAA